MYANRATNSRRMRNEVPVPVPVPLLSLVLRLFRRYHCRTIDDPRNSRVISEVSCRESRRQLIIFDAKIESFFFHIYAVYG